MPFPFASFGSILLPVIPNTFDAIRSVHLVGGEIIERPRIAFALMRAMAYGTQMLLSSSIRTLSAPHAAHVVLM
jgi:hypothetical protein